MGNQSTVELTTFDVDVYHSRLEEGTRVGKRHTEQGLADDTWGR